MCEHSCELCNYTLDEQASKIFDELPTLAIYVKDEIKNNLVYIAGYITRKVDASVEDSFMFFEKYGSYTECLSRGGLKIPGDSTCEWSVFWFIMFDEIKNKICRNSLIKVFQDIADHFEFCVQTSHCRILANTFINLYCRKSTHSPLAQRKPAKNNEALLNIFW